MIGIITGDIVNSQKHEPKDWLKVLKKELNSYGVQKKHWEIFQGDAFQLEIKDVKEVFIAAIKIKAALRAKGFDARLSIGIGEKSYKPQTLSESMGSAFIYSGQNLDKLGQSISMSSQHADFDEEMNLYLMLALVAIDQWTTKSAEVMKVALDNPDWNQQKIGKKLKIKQNSVSLRMKRAYYNEIIALDNMFRKKISSYISAS